MFTAQERGVSAGKSYEQFKAYCFRALLGELAVGTLVELETYYRVWQLVLQFYIKFKNSLPLVA